MNPTGYAPGSRPRDSRVCVIVAVEYDSNANRMTTAVRISRARFIRTARFMLRHMAPRAEGLREVVSSTFPLRRFRENPLLRARSTGASVEPESALAQNR